MSPWHFKQKIQVLWVEYWQHYKIIIRLCQDLSAGLSDILQVGV